jgi:hypothetical protein
MTEPNRQPTSDPLEEVVKAWRDDPVPEGPPAHLVASTIEALQTATTSPEVLRRRRDVMIRIARYGSMATAAAVFLALGASFFLMDHQAGLAFADVIANVKKARAVNFVCIQKLPPQPTLQTQWFLQGDAMRMEIPGIQESFRAKEPIVLAEVFNLKEKRALQLDFVRKIARPIEITEEIAKRFLNPIEQLRRLKSRDAERIPDEKLNGRTMQVYRLKKLDFFGSKGKVNEGESFKVWVDPTTGLPARIVIVALSPDRKGKMIFRFEQFTWNDPMAPEMFKVQVPKGFTLKEKKAR